MSWSWLRAEDLRDGCEPNWAATSFIDALVENEATAEGPVATSAHWAWSRDSPRDSERCVRATLGGEGRHLRCRLVVPTRGNRKSEWGMSRSPSGTVGAYSAVAHAGLACGLGRLGAV